VIEINLLPGAKKRRGGKGAGFQMPDLKALAATVKDPWLIACLAGWVLVSAAVGLFYMPRRAKIQSLEPQLAERTRVVVRRLVVGIEDRDALLQEKTTQDTLVLRAALAESEARAQLRDHDEWQENLFCGGHQPDRLGDPFAEVHVAIGIEGQFHFQRSSSTRS